MISNALNASSPMQSANDGRLNAHTWGNISSKDSSLIDSLQIAEQQSSLLQEGLHSLQGLNRIDVNLSFMVEGSFKENVEIQNKLSPEALKYVLANEKNNVGVYVKETPALHKSLPSRIDLVMTAPDKSQLPADEVAHALKQIAMRGANGAWPPIFAVLERPEAVPADEIKQLSSLSLDTLKQFTGTLVHDFSNEGYSPHHINTSEKVVAPVMTVKVAKGDTLMLQYALESVSKPGDMVFLDGGEVGGGRQATYANVGGLLREIAIKREVRGFVIDGFIRDSAEYTSEKAGQSFACYAKGITPNGPTKLESGAVHCPLQYGKATVNSNDIFIAEGNNLMIVPAGNVSKLIKMANAGEGSAGLKAVASNREQKTQVLGSRSAPGSSFNPRVVESRTAALPVAKETLTLMEHIPTAEFADAFSTLTPSLTVGIALRQSEKAIETKSAGTAVTVQAGRESIEKAIQQATPENTLVINANNSADIVLNDELIEAAAQKGVRAIVTNGTVVSSKSFGIPVHAAKFAEGKGAVKEGNESLHPSFTIGGVVIKPGDIVVGDEDGIAVIPPGMEEHGLRGGHGIASKEEKTVVAIREGTAADRVLPTANVYPVSASPLNIQFLQGHISGRNNNEPLATARGSSGLNVPVPDQIRFVAAGQVESTEGLKKLSTAMAAEGSKRLSNGTIKGIPSAVHFEATEPVVVALESVDVSGQSLGKMYVSGIAGENFSRMMLAKEQGKAIEIDPKGRVQIQGD